ncbi:hypothetical protein CKO15_09760 [Halorhodospira abdelmalekii]|uniref:HNH endonuclease domain-containing protein n=1 Tax=Halorhodospira abdelmalekii TaxID=421629 RepID=UPI0019051637|nr:HNH endonuclease domain-containing protein [Halorhodospira abdelmalekii]MBK1735563.1 hypothetical protein [Halorhodospira abdelmalekii]
MPDHDPAPLPEACGLNIAALAGLFRHTTNSYKFLFFLAILDLLRRHRFDAERPYAYREITIEMLAIAWYPHSYFKLSFGTQDTIAQKLTALDLDFPDSTNLFGNDRRALRETLASTDLRTAKRLMEFVPYRLITPFLDPQLREAGVDRGAWMELERELPRIANRHFDQARPLYRFNGERDRDCTAIFWHPEWAAYFEQHYSVAHGWAAWHWLQYMQRRNPSVPGLPKKLFPPLGRESMTRETRFWREVLKNPDGHDLRCIYSGAALSPDSFALDHYLPWSFVVHNQLWNLVPAPTSVNSAKSNCLPATAHLERLVDLQHRGLVIASKTFSPQAFNRFAEDYLTDLHLPSTASLLNYDQLAEAYEKHLPPLLTLASNQGFTPNWQYEEAER